MSESAEFTPPQTFEAALSALEDRVRQLDQGELPLEEALQLFEEGVVLQRACQDMLDATERRVIELTGQDAPSSTPHPGR